MSYASQTFSGNLKLQTGLDFLYANCCGRRSLDVVCWFIRRKARVPITGYEKKHFYGAFLSADFWQKLCHEKVSQKSDVRSRR